MTERLPCLVDGCTENRKGLGYCNRHYKKFKKYGDPFYEAFDKTPSQRLWAMVDKSGECWKWTGCVNNKGYGVFAVTHGYRVLVHRFAYEELVATIPPGMIIDHICHVTSCCNPQHLRVATQKQNTENLLGANRRSTTGYRGVERSTKAGRYAARVRHNGVRYHAGTFDSPEEAAEAARQLRLSLFTHNDEDRKSNAI